MPIFKKTSRAQAKVSTPKLVKNRQICFARHAGRDEQLHQAKAFLNIVKGIQAVNLKKPDKLCIKYSLQELSLKTIENAFIDLGFKLENGLMNRIKRSFCYYCEQTEIENRNIMPRTNQVTFSIYASRFKQMSHVCRDAKPVNWRRYL